MLVFTLLHNTTNGVCNPPVSFDLSPDVLLLVLLHTFQTGLSRFTMMLMYDKYNTEVD